MIGRLQNRAMALIGANRKGCAKVGNGEAKAGDATRSKESMNKIPVTMTLERMVKTPEDW
jgi:hypothetical protein